MHIARLIWIWAAIVLATTPPTTSIAGDGPDTQQAAFPTTFTVTSYSKETPKTGELQGTYVKRGKAEKEAARLRSLPDIARADIEVDLAPTDEMPAKTQPLVTAIKNGVEERAKNCNFLAKAIADSFHQGSGLTGTADDMLNFLGSDYATKRGWIDVNGKAVHDKKDVAETAIGLANEGMLVVGVISKAELNDNKPNDHKPYTSGHVFVLVPSPETGWHGGMVANAGTGETEGEQTARILLLDEVTTKWQRPLYHFFAIKQGE
jgi:hypothetical protein